MNSKESTDSIRLRLVELGSTHTHNNTHNEAPHSPAAPQVVGRRESDRFKAQRRPQAGADSSGVGPAGGGLLLRSGNPEIIRGARTRNGCASPARGRTCGADHS